MFEEPAAARRYGKITVTVGGSRPGHVLPRNHFFNILSRKSLQKLLVSRKTKEFVRFLGNQNEDSCLRWNLRVVLPHTPALQLRRAMAAVSNCVLRSDRIKSVIAILPPFCVTSGGGFLRKQVE